jgi:hypothetical protein
MAVPLSACSHTLCIAAHVVCNMGYSQLLLCRMAAFQQFPSALHAGDSAAAVVHVSCAPGWCVPEQLSVSQLHAGLHNVITTGCGGVVCHR